MTTDQSIVLPAYPVPRDDGVDTGRLIRVLAQVLRVQPERIDPHQTFHSLGVDSMLTVEFVATVNAHYASRIDATALYDHPTPAAFARHLDRETAIGPSGPRPAGPTDGTASVLGSLRDSLAAILRCDPWDIDESAAFPVLGLDSILGAQFVAEINRTYGLDADSVILYDHPNLAAMAGHLAAHAARTRAGRPVALDIDQLLDAVRDNRLSVDEAAALLDARSS
ncbi:MULTISPECIES: acyl carrier protein [Streptomyces]|uniref:Acyl carrier protein n=1 Tax=Streptomyces lienomycini TaxID=284035 RepID=A0ABV9X6R4_9ACTN|nr:acyl carrier protein [Streptomyces sp. NBC_00334]